MFQRKPVDWERRFDLLARRVGTFAVIRFSPISKLLGVNTKVIIIYRDGKPVERRLYDEFIVENLKRRIPVIDTTRGLPFPKEYLEVPPIPVFLGHLKLRRLPP